MYRKLSLGLTAVALLLSSCQTDGNRPTLSLAEAKRVTARFDRQSFVPPPKTIKNITAILDAQKREDVVAEREQTARADAKPPGTSDRAALAVFYYDRAAAAQKVGRLRQTFNDLTRSNELSQDLSRKEKSDILFRLGIAEFKMGKHRDAFRHLNAAIDVERRLVRLVTLTATLARLQALTGDIGEGQRALSDAERRMDAIRDGVSRRNTIIWNRWGTRMRQAVESTRAQILETSGRYAEAELLRRSGHDKLIQSKKELGRRFPIKPAHIDRLRAKLGRNLKQQGRLVEAEIEIRAALLSSLKRSGRYDSNVGVITSYLAEVMSAQGRPRDAEALARAAIEINQKIGAGGASGVMLLARRQLAGALAAQGRWRGVLKQLETMKAVIDDPATVLRFVLSDPRYAIALLRNGRAAEALPVARDAVERYRGRMGDKHYKTAQARGVLATLLAAAGDRKAALREFAAAVPILLQRSRRSDSETATQTSRDQRLGRMLESYIGLLASVHGTAPRRGAGIDAAAEAFRLADVARGQTVQRALIASAARAAAKDAALAGLVRREQDALKQIGALNALFANAVSVPTDQQDAAALKVLSSPLKKAALAEFHATTKHTAAKAVSPSCETMRTI